ncbi:TetR/AcrR family transcriptional regulator [Nocardia bhagyanarayanae]|uniref:TetR family transcriptional regulator n=1 Tax=Nocardia bhagyanarayanae TaxID=1215925 RepID=A0A543FHL9_9NOCA|nr:TetR/AcrR family transcriptional regulator [Nocardia bhagyanarayanae]TQM33262.1 TetR family transcriptional regulator [Nocardia bhagyanarayanae]
MSSERKGQLTSARMVDAMLDSIQSHGYAGTGINTVLAQAKAPRGSMYFHFPGGKEELGEQAIGKAAKQFQQLIADVTADAAGPGQLVTRIVEALIGLLVESDYALGCPVSVVTLEMGTHSDRLRTACATTYESWIAPVADYLMSAGHTADRARDLAETTLSTLEGAIILSRAARDTRPLASAARVLGPLLDQHATSTSESE